MQRVSTSQVYARSTSLFFVSLYIAQQSSRARSWTDTWAVLDALSFVRVDISAIITRAQLDRHLGCAGRLFICTSRHFCGQTQHAHTPDIFLFFSFCTGVVCTCNQKIKKQPESLDKHLVVYYLRTKIPKRVYASYLADS